MLEQFNIQKWSKITFVPSILLSSVQSLELKINKFQQAVFHSNSDLICLTETRLQEHVLDIVIAIDGYILIRLDRKTATHGGVCMYIKNSIQCSVLNDLFDPTLEVLWVKIQPTRLPRGISTIFEGVLYHPPSAEDTVMFNYLIENVTSIEFRCANCGILVLGDFN